MKPKVQIPILYSVAALIYLVFETLNPKWILTLTFKGLPLLLLIIYFAISSKSLPRRQRIFLLSGLIFSLFGDLILQWSNRNAAFFLPGLACFLITQLSYSLSFLQGGHLQKRFLGSWAAALVLISYGVMLVGWLKPGLGPLLIPVSVYAAVIVTMSFAAFTRRLVMDPLSYMSLLLGAILFLASDSMIAISRFGHEFHLSRVLIIVSYFLAQLLIINGMLHIPLKKDYKPTNNSYL
jgi:uncharacterized membrane protein YhhN